MTDQLPLIHLRAIEPEDLDVLYNIENDTEVWNVSTTNVPYSRYILYDYIANTKNDIYADRQVRMMIEDENHDVAGIVDIINFDPKNMRAEVGIVIKQKYRNKGYAMATLTRIKAYASHIHVRQSVDKYSSHQRRYPECWHSLELFRLLQPVNRQGDEYNPPGPVLVGRENRRGYPSSLRRKNGPATPY